MALIKICGMNESTAVAAALAAGADAIGFVFAPSVRRVTPAQAATLALPARGKALCVAVTLHPDAQLLQQIFELFQPDVLQTDASDLTTITLPPGIIAWPVWREFPAENAAAILRPGQHVLFEGARSGTGKVADWSAAQVLARHHPLILAGGLSPANVAAAIAAVQPAGVDVSSGVETAPGRKDPALIELFVSRARAAFSRPGSGEH